MGLDDFSQITTKKSVPGPGSYDLPSDFDSNARAVASHTATFKFRDKFGSTEVLTGTDKKVGPGSYEVPQKFSVDAPSYSFPRSGMHRFDGGRGAHNDNDASSSPNSRGNSPMNIQSPRQYNMSDYPSTPSYTIGSKLPPPAEPGHGFGPGPCAYTLPTTMDQRAAPIAFRPLPSQLHANDQPGPSDYDLPRFPEQNDRRFPSPLAHQRHSNESGKQKHTFGAVLNPKTDIFPGPGQYIVPSSFDPPKKEAPPPVVPGASVDVTAAGSQTDSNQTRGRTTFGGRGGDGRRINTIGPGPGQYDLPSSMNINPRNGVTIVGRHQSEYEMAEAEVLYPRPGPGQYVVNRGSKAHGTRVVSIAPLPLKNARALTEDEINKNKVRYSYDGEFEQNVYHPEHAEEFYKKLGPSVSIASVPFKHPTHSEMIHKDVESRKAERHDDDDGPFGKKATRGVRRHKCPFGQVHSDRAELPHKLSSKQPPSFSMAFRTPIAGFLGPADPSVPGPGSYFDADKEKHREARCAIDFSHCPFSGAGEYAPRVLTREEKDDVNRASKSVRSGKGGAELVFSRKSSPRTPRAPITSPAAGIGYYLHKLGGASSVTNQHRAPGPNHYDDVQAWEKLHSPRGVKLSPRTSHQDLPNRLNSSKNNNSTSARKVTVVPHPPPK